MSGIRVTNQSRVKIYVAINHWGKDGDTSFFTINQSESEKWDRTDDRGFVMVIRNHDFHPKNSTYWYVQAGKEIYVKDSNEVVGALQIL